MRPRFSKPSKRIVWGNDVKNVSYSSNEDDDDDDEDSSTCRVVENSIYFYSEIEPEYILELSTNLRKTANRIMINAITTEAQIALLFLHIHSQGGDVYAGLAGMDAVLSSKVPVTTIVDGFVASAATFLLIAGNKRQMTKHGYVLIHQLSSNFWGKYTEFEDEKMNMDALMETLRGVYRERTKIPKATLDSLLKRDLLLDADTCFKYGLIDEII